jgi:hypothetical protein
MLLQVAAEVEQQQQREQNMHEAESQQMQLQGHVQCTSWLAYRMLCVLSTARRLSSW